MELLTTLFFLKSQLIFINATWN